MLEQVRRTIAADQLGPALDDPPYVVDASVVSTALWVTERGERQCYCVYLRNTALYLYNFSSRAWFQIPISND